MASPTPMTLEALLRASSPVDPQRALSIVTAICNAVTEANRAGVFHRALLPTAIDLVDEPTVRVMILPAASAPATPFDPDARVSKHPIVDYASPELLMGKALDARSDVYSVGVIAFELLTGTRPFSDAKGPAGLITAQLKQRPRAPSVVRPSAGITVHTDAVILRCLAKEPGDRFADASALALAIA